MSDYKANLTDKVVKGLSLSDDGQYIVRDTELPGFFIRVGARTKTFTVQGEFWKDGKRHTRKIAIGSSEEMTTRDARVAAKATLAKIAQGEFEEAPKTETKPAADITLREAWARYKTAHLERKKRSAATIAGYTDHVERLLADWLDRPLRELGEEPSLVSKRHDDLTVSSGPYGANGCMRTLRAIYNHARKSVRDCRRRTR